jgi:hypothetical protein
MIRDYHKDANTYLDNIFIFHNLFYRLVFSQVTQDRKYNSSFISMHLSIFYWHEKIENCLNHFHM